MASKVLVQNSICNNMNKSVLSSRDMPSKTHSFGQVILPKKSEVSSSRKSVIASFTPNFITQNINKLANLASLWRQVQGCNDWEDLVEPLHPLLRQETVRYGEFVSACYKAFDLDPTSKRYLKCKYSKKNTLKEVGMENCGYEVTKFIYATPNINIPLQDDDASCGRWIGYVAVSTDDEVKRLGRRDIVVSFRGTVTNHEWVANFMSSLVPARLDPNDPRPEVKVELGFLSLYTCDESNTNFGVKSCREQLLSEISRLLNKYKGEEISISLAGHSMGSSLALLLGYDIAELGLNKTEGDQVVPVTVFSYGGPRVGNLGFKERCEELGVKVLRVVNVNDPITKLPGVFFNENSRPFFGGKIEFPWSCSCYAHVGVELVMDFFNMQNPSCVHDLEAYISLLKCPKLLAKNHDHQLEVGLNWAKDFLHDAQSKFDMSPFKTVESNVVDFCESLRAQFFTNEMILGLNSLALYILL